MIVRKYEPQDFAQIAQWGKSHETEYTESQFPKTGFIVDGLAAYFLYTTDSSICFLENLVSNNDANFTDRRDAIKLVIDAALTEAKEKGFQVAYATTDIPTVIARATKYGCEFKTNQTLITKSLGPSL